MSSWWEGRKQLLLLIVVVAMLVVQPMAARAGFAGRPVIDALLVAVCLLAVRALPWRSWHRRLGMIAFGVAISANFAHYAAAGRWAAIPIVFHAALAVFLGLAIVAILRDILARQRIETDEVFGAVVGYLFGALAWAHLFALAERIVPDSFSFAPQLAVQLDDWHLRRALFDYLSFTTLTSIGWGEVTPVAPPATTLTLLEVVCGQFYMAIVVATLVGLKLAAALRDDGAAD